MKNLVTLIFSTLCLVLLFGCNSSYKLVWSDDFSTPGLPDKAKWTYEEGYIRNHELQCYKADNLSTAQVKDGTLVITVNKDNSPTDSITSASIISKGAGEWKYGRFEVSAILPQGKGVWPAIWMIPADCEYGSWPRSGELDIMEYVGHIPDSIFITVHTQQFNGSTQKGTHILARDLHSRFHKYSMDWSPDKIDFFFDNKKVYTFKKIRNDYKVWPFDRKFYFVLNVAYGGSWGGQKGIDTSILPQSMVIDYVKVFQKAPRL